MLDETLIEHFLDHLWLIDRLSANTLAAYRRDLSKVSQRLKTHNQTLETAEYEHLSAAIFDYPEQNSSKSRTLSSVRRFMRGGRKSDTANTIPHNTFTHRKKVVICLRLVARRRLTHCLPLLTPPCPQVCEMPPC